MQAEAKKVEPIPPSAPGAAPERDRSTIEFPYLDLENGAEIAQGVHAVGGTGCDWDQLAAHLKQAAQGGGFRLRMICAKQFGLVTYDRGKVSLTSLGLRLVDPQQSKTALVESFLTIPLYKAIYEKFRGSTLPPLKGLEREMQTLGVAAKQTDKARQAFARSAKFAGFFDFGADRLVSPKITPNAGSPALPAGHSGNTHADTPPIGAPARGGGTGGGQPPDIHPAIMGLLLDLPAPGTPISDKRRENLIGAFTGVIRYIYPAKEDE